MNGIRIASVSVLARSTLRIQLGLGRLLCCEGKERKGKERGATVFQMSFCIRFSPNHHEPFDK